LYYGITEYTTNEYDAYLQWVKYSLLTNVQEMSLLHYECTHMAYWLAPITNEWTK